MSGSHRLESQMMQIQSQQMAPIQQHVSHIPYQQQMKVAEGYHSIPPVEQPVQASGISGMQQQQQMQVMQTKSASVASLSYYNTATTAISGALPPPDVQFHPAQAQQHTASEPPAMPQEQQCIMPSTAHNISATQAQCSMQGSSQQRALQQQQMNFCSTSNSATSTSQTATRKQITYQFQPPVTSTYDICANLPKKQTVCYRSLE